MAATNTRTGASSSRYRQFQPGLGDAAAPAVPRGCPQFVQNRASPSFTFRHFSQVMADLLPSDAVDKAISLPWRKLPEIKEIGTVEAVERPAAVAFDTSWS